MKVNSGAPPLQPSRQTRPIHPTSGGHLQDAALSRGAGSCESEITESHCDQSQHERARASDHSVARARTTVGEGHNQHAVHRGDHSVTRATLAPSRPEAVPKRPVGRAKASPPTTTPITPSRATVVAQSRRAVGPYTVVAAGSETCPATSTAYTRPANRAAAARPVRMRTTVRFMSS